MKKVLFSCQNAQELEDLILVATELKHKHNVTPVLYDVSRLMGKEFEDGLVKSFPVRYTGIRLFKESFKDLSALKKLTLSFVNALNLIRICLKERCSICVIGVPLLVYRLMGGLALGRLTTISYIRGIVAYSGDETSLSSKVYLRLRRLAKIRILNRVISDYFADIVVCIGRVTKDFIGSRGVREGDIKVIGSVFCDSRLEACKQPSVNQGVGKELVYLSSAFAAHGYEESQYAQTHLVLGILRFLNSKYSSDQFKFIVRKHPRESSSFYEEFQREGGLVDDAAGDASQSYSSDALFLSTLSTLIFELAYLGEKTALISNDFFVSEHGEWYAALGAKPVVEWEKLLDEHLSGGQTSRIQGFELDNIISTQHKGRVVSDFSNLILGAF